MGGKDLKTEFIIKKYPETFCEQKQMCHSTDENLTTPSTADESLSVVNGSAVEVKKVANRKNILLKQRTSGELDDEKRGRKHLKNEKTTATDIEHDVTRKVDGKDLMTELIIKKYQEPFCEQKQMCHSTDKNVATPSTADESLSVFNGSAVKVKKVANRKNIQLKQRTSGELDDEKRGRKHLKDVTRKVDGKDLMTEVT